MKIDFNDILKQILLGELEQKESDEKMKLYKICGVYGTISSSENQMYKIVFTDGHIKNENWENGTIVLLKNDEVLFNIRPERPKNCLVSNTGFVICCDWLNSDGLNGKFIIFDKQGKEHYSVLTTANLKATSISQDGKFAIFTTYHSKTEDSEKVFVIDILNKNICSKFNIPVIIKRIFIDSQNERIAFIENDEFIFETDFNGVQVNNLDYENQIFTKGNICDKLWYFSTKPDNDRYKDERFLNVVTEAFKDSQAIEVYEKAFLLKLRGEYYLFNNQIEKALIDWSEAIALKPNIGLKSKIKSLKKNDST